MKEPTTITRRAAMRLLLGAGALALAPHSLARAITQEDIDKTEAALADAQERYAEVEEQLEDIAVQYEELSIALAETLDKIDKVNGQIRETEAKIEDCEAELEEKRERLAKRVRSAYKAGNGDALAAILASTSFEELGSNIYYLDKISESDRQLIEDVEQLKSDLENHQAELENRRAELEELRATQEDQLAQMQEKQEEVRELLEALDESVQALVVKRDDQILQLAREREEQRRREEEARKAAEAAAAAAKAEAEAAAAAAAAAQQDSGDDVGAQADNVTGSYNDGQTSGSQASVIAACHSTPSPGAGYCAAWVSQVFANAGLSYAGGNANDMYNWWTTSSDRSDLKPGMIVAVSTHSHTWAGRIYGHIGIYIGSGIMMDNVGFIRTISVDEWVNYYSTTVTPRWGWLMGIPLS